MSVPGRRWAIDVPWYFTIVFQGRDRTDYTAHGRCERVAKVMHGGRKVRMVLRSVLLLWRVARTKRLLSQKLLHNYPFTCDGVVVYGSDSFCCSISFDRFFFLGRNTGKTEVKGYQVELRILHFKLTMPIHGVGAT